MACTLPKQAMLANSHVCMCDVCLCLRVETHDQVSLGVLLHMICCCVYVHAGIAWLDASHHQGC